MSKIIQGIKRKPVLTSIIVFAFIGLFIANQIFAEINGGTVLATVRTVPPSGYSIGYGDVTIGGSASISGQFKATEKSYISTVVVKYWRSGQTTKYTVFDETLASDTYNTWSKTRSIYFSPGTFYISIVITTTGATVDGSKSYESSFTVTTTAQPTATTTQATTTEDSPSFEFWLLIIIIPLVIVYKKRRKDSGELN